MIFLGLSLFLQFDLLQCVEFEKVDFKSLIRRHNQNISLRNNTLAAFQLDPITPEFAFFTPPEDFRLSPTHPHQTRRSQNIHGTQHKIGNNYFRKTFFRHRSRPKKHQRFTVFDSFKTTAERELRQKSQEKASSYNFRDLETFERSSSESEQEASAYTSDNSYARSEEKTADDSESSTESGVFTTKQRRTVSPAMRTKRTAHTRHKRLKPNILLPVTLLERIGDDLKKTTQTRSKSKWNSDGKDVLKKKRPTKDLDDNFFSDDTDIFKLMKPSKDKLEVLRMHVRSKHKKTLKPATIRQTPTDVRNADYYADILKTLTPPRSKKKWNLDGYDGLWRKPHKDKPGGMFGDDDDIFKMMKLRKHKNKLAMRMHAISTKKVWYSDKMLVEHKERIEDPTTSLPATDRQSLDHTTTVATITKVNKYASSSIEYLRTPLSNNYLFKIMDRRGEGYMMVFLIELMQIIVSKDAYEAHDIVKHADPIIQRQSKKLMWMGHPFLEVTRKFTTMLKVIDINSVQDQANNILHKLLKRHETLPVLVNTVLEYAETMYNDDEGRALFDALRELDAFPKIPLSGYWLCNSLINAFLRPFRRLQDTQKLKELMDSINLELKRQDPLRSYQKQPQRSERGSGAQSGSPAVADNQPSPHNGSSIQTVPQTTRPQTSRKKRKRKRHHHRKRKRDEVQLLFRSRHTQRDQRLTLTSATPKTTSQWWFRDTTYKRKKKKKKVRKI